LITWFPVIWGDRQWDHYFFFVLLRKKLERMELFYRSKKVHNLNALDDAINIHYCIERLDRIINCDYLEKTLQPFYEKYPDYDWDLGRRFVEREDGLLEYVNNDTDEEKELWRKCSDQADLDEQNDLDELFAHIRLHIEEWWD
jgi:hypothetical protein